MVASMGMRVQERPCDIQIVLLTDPPWELRNNPNKEAADTHPTEGASGELLLVYRRNGALPEYCGAFATEFDGVDFPETPGSNGWVTG